MTPCTLSVKRRILEEMIRSFRCPDTERLFRRLDVPRFRGTADSARTRLERLDAAQNLNDLLVIRGNRLELLKGTKGLYSIRINDQWRICFRWLRRAPEDVEIVDYH